MPVHQLDHRTGTYTIGGIVQPELAHPPRDLPPPTSVHEPTPLVMPDLGQLVLSGEVELGVSIHGGVHKPLPACDIASALRGALDGWVTSSSPMEAEECDFFVRGI